MFVVIQRLEDLGSEKQLFMPYIFEVYTKWSAMPQFKLWKEICGNYYSGILYRSGVAPWSNQQCHSSDENDRLESSPTETATVFYVTRVVGSSKLQNERVWGRHRKFYSFRGHCARKCSKFNIKIIRNFNSPISSAMLLQVTGSKTDKLCLEKSFFKIKTILDWSLHYLNAIVCLMISGAVGGTRGNAVPQKYYIFLNCCHQMSYFKAKMHQIRFWLGLTGSLQLSPTPSWI